MIRKVQKAKKAGKILTAAALSVAFVMPAFFNVASPVTPASAIDVNSDYTAVELQEKMEDLNLQIAEEGVVLLKNKDNALPFKRNDRHVTVFHSCWDPWSKEKYAGNVVENMEIGGSGSGGSGGVLPHDPKSVYDGLEENGFDVNKSVRSLYDKYKVDYNYAQKDAKGEKYVYDNRYINTIKGPNLDILKKAEKSFYNFNDAAIITISRQEGEDFDIINGSKHNDLFFNLAEHQKDEGGAKHYLQLNKGEKDLIAYAKDNFAKVVVVINTGMQMELAELEDDDGIDAVLWSGIAGENGLKAIGGVLSGAVNPSGKLPDTWAADFTKDPTYVNFGDGRHLDEVKNSPIVGEGQYTGNASINGGGYGMYGVDYSEGIYVGYRFYETAYTIGYFGSEANAYYNRTNGVVYPFGRGLSYTTFTQEIVGDIDTSGDTISFDVKVKNTGNVAGKEVVQVYYDPQYTAGGIEKSSVNLVAFAKTEKIQPGNSETVTITFDKRDMASYDYNDANDDGHKGYELEVGDYKISLRSDSHTVISEKTYNHASKTDYDKDKKTGKTIEQLFSGEGNIYNVDRREFTVDGSGVEYMHRSIKKDDGTEVVNGFGDSEVGTFPEVRLAQYAKSVSPWIDESEAQGKIIVERGEGENAGKVKVTTGAYPDGYACLKDGLEMIFFYTLQGKKDAGISPVGNKDDYERAYEEFGLLYEWVKTEDDVAGWTQAAKREKGEKTEIQLKQMIGIELNDEPLTEDVTALAKEGGVFAGKTGNEAWKIFMDQLTYEEIATIASNAYFQTAAIDAIGKPVTDDNDGPAQLRNHDDTAYSYGFASGCTIAATWNEKLAEEFGVVMGEWAVQNGMTGWYGPSMNIHRSPFCGRNYEYYSEDPVLSSFLGAATVKGAHSKGLVSYIKHFAMNNQETYRHGVIVWSDEQTMREIYLKSFEKALKESDSLGIMTSMNRIGMFQAGSNYNFTIKLLREEWGYNGIIISDFSSGTGVQYNLRCGVLPLGNSYGTVEGKWDSENGYPVFWTGSENKPAYSEWYAARNAAQNLLYTMCKSNAIRTKVDPTLYVSDSEPLEITIYEGEYRVPINLMKDGTKGYDYFILKNVTNPGNFSAYDSRSGKTQLCMPGQYYVDAEGFRSIGDVGFPVASVTDYEITAYAEDGTVITRQLKVSVVPPVVLANGHATVGVPFSTKVVLARDDIEGLQFTEVTEIADNETCQRIPWLRMNKDGTISGTPTEAGTYNIKILLNDEYWIDTMTLVVHEKGWAPTPEFRVSEGILQYRVMEGSWQDIGVVASVDKTSTDGLVDTYTVTFSNGESFTYTVTNGADGVDGTNGTNGTNGTDGSKGDAGAKGETGAAGTDGKDGANGKDGVDGKGIKSAVINDKGELVITYTDDTSVNLGVVKGADGKNGANGTDGKDGNDGAAAEGCGSAVGVAAPLGISVVLMLALLAVVSMRRKAKNNK